MAENLLGYEQFSFRGRPVVHIEGGWCAAKVTAPNRVDTVWRIYWGLLGLGASRPRYITAHLDEQGHHVDFHDFEDCVKWVCGRRKKRKREEEKEEDARADPAYLDWLR